MNKEKKKPKIIKKILFVLIGVVIAFILISLFNLIFPSTPKFIIYQQNETGFEEVDYLTMKSGFEAVEGWNSSRFGGCANQSYYSKVDWYDFIYECMEGKGIKIIISNVTLEDINPSFLEANCEWADENAWVCGTEYIVEEK